MNPMPPLDSIGAFALTALVLIVVPGPSVLFVISRGVALGRRAALATVVGNAVGEFVQVLGVGVGLGGVVQRSILLFNLVKVAGAAYLVFLGVQAIRHRRALSTVLDAGLGARPTRSLLTDGFLVGLTNPKSIVFFAAILPQFIDRHGAPAPLQMSVLGLVFILIALVSDSCWGLLAGTARAWLSSSPRRLELLGGTSGLVIIGLGLRLVFTSREK